MGTHGLQAQKMGLGDLGRELGALDTWSIPSGRNVEWKYKTLRRNGFKVYILPGKIDILSPPIPLKIITRNKRFNGVSVMYVLRNRRGRVDKSLTLR